MKHRIVQDLEQTEESVIATFGEARLLKVNGKLHLRGGSMSDRIEALEWISLFMPQEVVSLQRP